MSANKRSGNDKPANDQSHSDGVASKPGNDNGDGRCPVCHRPVAEMALLCPGDHLGARPLHYIEVNGVPVPMKRGQLLEWANWYETANRSVARDELPGAARLSTVFLGIDQGFLPRHAPLLYESMVFGGPCNHWQWRWPTRKIAFEAHRRILARLVPMLANDITPCEFAHFNPFDKD